MVTFSLRFHGEQVSEEWATDHKQEGDQDLDTSHGRFEKKNLVRGVFWYPEKIPTTCWSIPRTVASGLGSTIWKQIPVQPAARGVRRDGIAEIGPVRQGE